MAETFLQNALGSSTGEPVVPIAEDDEIPDNLINGPSESLDEDSPLITPEEEQPAAEEDTSLPDIPSGPDEDVEKDFIAPLSPEEEAAIQREINSASGAVAEASGPTVEASGPTVEPSGSAAEPSGPAAEASSTSGPVVLPPFETNYQRYTSEARVDPETLAAFAEKHQQQIQTAATIEIVKEDIAEQEQIIADAKGLQEAEKLRLDELQAQDLSAEEALKSISSNVNAKEERLEGFDEEQEKVSIAAKKLKAIQGIEAEAVSAFNGASTAKSESNDNLTAAQGKLEALITLINSLKVDEEKLSALQDDLNRQMAEEGDARKALERKQEEIAKADQELQELITASSVASEKAEDMELALQEKGTLEGKLKGLRDALATLEAAAEAKETAKVGAAATLQKAEAAFGEADAKATLLDERLQEQKLLESVIKILSDENSAASQILTKRTGNISTASGALLDMDDAAAEAEQKVTAMEEALEGLAQKEAEVMGLEGAIAALQDAIADLQNQINRIEAEELSPAQEELNTAAAAVKKRAGLQTDWETKEEAIKTADAAVKKMEAAIETAKTVTLPAAAEAEGVAKGVVDRLKTIIDTMSARKKEIDDLVAEKDGLPAEITTLETSAAPQQIITDRKKKLYDIDKSYFDEIQSSYNAISELYATYAASPTSANLGTLRTSITNFLNRLLQEMTMMKQIEAAKADVGIVDGLDPGTCPRAKFLRIFQSTDGETVLHVSKIAVYTKSGDNVAVTSKLSASTGTTAVTTDSGDFLKAINGNLSRMFDMTSVGNESYNPFFKTAAGAYIQLEFDRPEEIDYVLIIYPRNLDRTNAPFKSKIQLLNDSPTPAVVSEKITTNHYRIQCTPFGSAAAGRAVTTRNERLLKDVFAAGKTCTPRSGVRRIRLLNPVTPHNNLRVSQIEAYDNEGNNLISSTASTAIGVSSLTTFTATSTGNYNASNATSGTAIQPRPDGVNNGYVSNVNDNTQYIEVNFNRDVSLSYFVRVANTFAADTYNADGTINTSSTGIIQRRNLVGQRLQLFNNTSTTPIATYTFKTGENFELISLCEEDHTAAEEKRLADEAAVATRNFVDDYIEVIKTGLGLDETSADCRPVSATHIRIRPSLANLQLELSQIRVYDTTGKNIITSSMRITGTGLHTTASGTNIPSSVLLNGADEPRFAGAATGGLLFSNGTTATNQITIEFGKSVDVAYVILFGVRTTVTPAFTNTPARMNGIRIELFNMSGTTEVDTVTNATTNEGLIQLVPFCRTTIERQFQRILDPLKTAAGHPINSPSTTTKARYVRIFGPAWGGFINGSQICIYDAANKNIMTDSATTIKAWRIPLVKTTYGTWPPYTTKQSTLWDPYMLQNTSQTSSILDVTATAFAAGYGRVSVLRDGLFATTLANGTFISKSMAAQSYKSQTTGDNNTFIEIDLGSEKDISYIVHINRTDSAADNTVAGLRYILFGEEYSYVMEKQIQNNNRVELLSFCQEALQTEDTTLFPASAKAMYDDLKESVSLPNTGTPIKTRYVRLRLVGGNVAFEISQVAVFNPAGLNIAKYKSIIHYPHGNMAGAPGMQLAATATRVVDDTYETRAGNQGFIFSANTTNSYIEIDLGSIQDVAFMVVTYPKTQYIPNVNVICEFRQYKDFLPEYTMILLHTESAGTERRLIPVGTYTSGQIINQFTTQTNISTTFYTTQAAYTFDINMNRERTINKTIYYFAKIVPLIFNTLPSTYTARAADNLTAFNRLSEVKRLANIDESLPGLHGATKIRLRPSLGGGDGIISFSNIFIFDSVGNNISLNQDGGSAILNSSIASTPAPSTTNGAVIAPSGLTGFTNSVIPSINSYRSATVTDAPTSSSNLTRYNTFIDITLPTTGLINPPEVRYIVIVNETSQDGRLYGLRVELINNSNVTLSRNIVASISNNVGAVSFATKDILFDTISATGAASGDTKFNRVLGPLLRDFMYSKYNIPSSCSGIQGVSKIRLRTRDKNLSLPVTNLHVYNTRGENVLRVIQPPTNIGTPVIPSGGTASTTDPNMEYYTTDTGLTRRYTSGTLQSLSVVGDMNTYVSAITGVQCNATWSRGTDGIFRYTTSGGTQCRSNTTYWFRTNTDLNQIMTGDVTTNSGSWGQRVATPIPWGYPTTIFSRTVTLQNTASPKLYDPWLITDRSVIPYSLNSDGANRHGYLGKIDPNYIQALTINLIPTATQQPQEIQSVIYFNRTDNFWTAATNILVELLDANNNVLSSKPIVDSSLVSAVNFCLSEQAGGARRIPLALKDKPRHSETPRSRYKPRRKTRRSGRLTQKGAGLSTKEYVEAVPRDKIREDLLIADLTSAIIPVTDTETHKKPVTSTAAYIILIESVANKSKAEWDAEQAKLDNITPTITQKQERLSDLTNTLIPEAKSKFFTDMEFSYDDYETVSLTKTSEKAAADDTLLKATAARELVETNINTWEGTELPALRISLTEADSADKAAKALLDAEQPADVLAATQATASTKLHGIKGQITALEAQRDTKQNTDLPAKEGELKILNETTIPTLKAEIESRYGSDYEAVRQAAIKARAEVTASQATLELLRANAGNVEAAAGLAKSAVDEKEAELKGLVATLEAEFGTDLTVYDTRVTEARAALETAKEAAAAAERDAATAAAAVVAGQADVETAQKELTAAETRFAELYGANPEAIRKEKDAAAAAITAAEVAKAVLVAAVEGLETDLSKVSDEIKTTNGQIGGVIEKIKTSYENNSSGLEEKIGVVRGEIEAALGEFQEADRAFTQADAELKAVVATREIAANDLAEARGMMERIYGGDRNALVSAASGAIANKTAAEVAEAAAQQAVDTQEAIYKAASLRVEQEEARLAQLKLDLTKVEGALAILEQEYRVLRSRLEEDSAAAAAKALANAQDEAAAVKAEEQERLEALAAATAEAQEEAAAATEAARLAAEAGEDDSAELMAEAVRLEEEAEAAAAAEEEAAAAIAEKEALLAGLDEEDDAAAAAAAAAGNDAALEEEPSVNANAEQEQINANLRAAEEEMEKAAELEELGTASAAAEQAAVNARNAADRAAEEGLEDAAALAEDASRLEEAAATAAAEEAAAAAEVIIAGAEEEEEEEEVAPVNTLEEEIAASGAVSNLEDQMNANLREAEEEMEREARLEELRAATEAAESAATEAREAAEVAAAEGLEGAAALAEDASRLEEAAAAAAAEEEAAEAAADAAAVEAEAEATAEGLVSAEGDELIENSGDQAEMNADLAEAEKEVELEENLKELFSAAEEAEAAAEEARIAADTAANTGSLEAEFLETEADRLEEEAVEARRKAEEAAADAEAELEGLIKADLTDEELAAAAEEAAGAAEEEITNAAANVANVASETAEAEAELERVKEEAAAEIAAAEAELQQAAENVAAAEEDASAEEDEAEIPEVEAAAENLGLNVSGPALEEDLGQIESEFIDEVNDLERQVENNAKAAAEEAAAAEEEGAASGAIEAGQEVGSLEEIASSLVNQELEKQREKAAVEAAASEASRAANEDLKRALLLLSSAEERHSTATKSSFSGLGSLLRDLSTEAKSLVSKLRI